MQTFLPYPSFKESLRVLDRQRLGKQRVECKQLLGALGFEIARNIHELRRKPPTTGWSNHPAAKMWEGYELALAVYMTTAVYEWVGRGYNNTMLFLADTYDHAPQNVLMPPWLGDDAFHASHRSNLLRKDPDWYGRFGWKEPHDLPYIWPKGL